MNKILPLFLSFLQIGFLSIGGGYATIPLIQDQAVRLHSWLTIQEFTDIITISQMTPGPLAVNTATFVGIRIAGTFGAVAATIGCILSGFFLSLFLYRFFQKHRQSEYISHLLDGLRSASAGLIASASFTLLLLALFGTSGLPNTLSQLQPFAVFSFAISLLALRKWRWNPMLVLCCTGLLGLLIV